METSVERGRRVRRRLLDAAAQLVAERGWGAVSTRALAERAGVAPGLVHYHFPSVQELRAEAAVDAARSVAAQVGRELDGTRDADEVAAVLLRVLDVHDGTDPLSVLLLEAYLAATRDEELRRALGDVVAELRGLVAARLTAHAVPDPDATAAVLVAVVDGLLLHRALTPGPGAGELTAAVRGLLGPGVAR
ncbi:TetR/AcrR family transcriptional regulator [Paenibacillus sp. TRM 82003]|uniref:TetR/AcrR family transcriptional regulator n=1 Tax=Kineococcus sp. TRM81007 TaxID=2925831 RepID=UPI001F57824F|nr:TetR/AcrR family transcriptional regulator [Kineococcus sp. TRM81007]MCI2237006.1 TetR/AcrR family transcriptional regulator [Kineococcus sp. TRM81007]MCI3926599.1 TetR/AcrR family transcriptional regulator [Paenibacillus sp. TRM 82003]